MEYRPELVLRVNEIYHDIEGRDYDRKHDDIFQGEMNRWRNIANKYFADNADKVRILDIGTGTGFVPLQLGGELKKEDLFVCADISDNMLKICREKIAEKNFICNFEFLKLESNKIDLESNTFDYITLNAVLHHIPEFSIFFKEIDRLLKLNSHLIICHEPNKNFFKHRFLWNNYKIFSFVLSPKRSILSAFKKTGLFLIARNLLPRLNKEKKMQHGIAEEINKRLIKEKIIDTHLTSKQIGSIVDVHSPTAGGFHRDRGIDIAIIITDFLQNYEIEVLETYNHLFKISSKNNFTEWYSEMLKKKYPNSGATFMAVLKKKK